MAATTRMTVLRPFTTKVFNRLTRPFAGWLPGFGILTYKGRTSGRVYRTPINVFLRDGWYVFALTYGADTQWVKNVLAAGGAELRTRGHDILLVAPERFHDPAARRMPLLVRLILRANRVSDFLRMRPPNVAL